MQKVWIAMLALSWEPRSWAGDAQDFGCSGTQTSRRVDSQTVELLKEETQ